jgi:hypothetical protein
MRSRRSLFRPTPRVYWLAFLDWLACGVWGMLPFTLRATLGPVSEFLPLAGHVAHVLSPWLLARRLGGAPPEDASDAALARQIAADLAVRPLTQGEARPDLAWLGELLAADLARLLRLLAAPCECFCRPDGLAWEIRDWALVISLARIGQVYDLLERLHSPEVARQVWWQQFQQAGQPEGG